MKVLALDLGNRWTGTALSDGLRMFAKPYKTVETKNLKSFLEELFNTEKISIIAVGHPKTLKGTDSEQTKIIVTMYEQLKEQFPKKEWALWDERLTSKQASNMGASRKGDKQAIHSVAAAIILESYLGHLQFKASNS